MYAYIMWLFYTTYVGQCSELIYSYADIITYTIPCIKHPLPHILICPNCRHERHFWHTLADYIHYYDIIRPDKAIHTSKVSIYPVGIDVASQVLWL